ncbi:MAG: efflux RND transporter permease subunit [Elusimicrobia bacterium]|nr:efflux RND transporter permease subunit [Elusimicrobiota bacterium]
MKLADVSISRPIFATMMISALVVLGLSPTPARRRPVSEYRPPVVTVSTTLRGASPRDRETSLTRDQEAANTISGITSCARRA